MILPQPKSASTGHGNSKFPAAHDLLGRPLLDDVTDPQTGEIVPVIVVTDNGAAYRAAGFARLIASRPELRHVRTRIKSPETNGVVERFFGAIKAEQRWRALPDVGPAMGVAAYRRSTPPDGRRGARPALPACRLHRPLTPPDALVPTRQTLPLP